MFDPAKHMHVAEVKPGMTGHGLSVFSGSKIERFEVEVISVLRNFNPKYDVILIKCKGQNLEHTGAVAGMSGSPIYLKDAAGAERMIGAFAYGWPGSKDPIAGVQPIEYMLSIPTGSSPPPAGGAKPVVGSPDGAGQKPAAGAETRARWSMHDALGNWERYANPGSAAKGKPLGGCLGGVQTKAGGDDLSDMRLQPLATPLMTAGVSPKLLEQFGPLFQAHGLTPLQAGTAGKATDGEPIPKIEPGSVLTVPMLIGDVDMTALGTTTEVLDGRVYGFGHPFNNEGQVLLPIGAGTINHIVATRSTSFKIGAMVGSAGTLTADRAVGIAGRTGEAPPLAPIDIRVIYAGGDDVNYHMEAALHPRLTPLLAGLAISSALNGTQELPQYNTVDFDLDLEFTNGKTIRLSDTIANAAGNDLFRFIGMPLLTAADNPFGAVNVKRVSGTVRVAPEPRLASITEVNLPKSKYRPGETLQAFVEFKRFRGGEDLLPVQLELPKDLNEGNYQLVISDWTRYMQDEQQSKPFRFTGYDMEELFDALADFNAIRQNAIYLRLVRQADGVAIGRTALPKLPSSRRQMLLGSGRSGTTRFVNSTTKTIPTDMVMEGSAQFVITIDADATVELGKPGAPVAGDGAGGDAAAAAPAEPGAAGVVLPEPPADKPEPPAQPEPPADKPPGEPPAGDPAPEPSK